MGLGKATDPLGDKKKDLTSATQAMQEMITTQTIAIEGDILKLETKTITMMKTMQKQMQAAAALNNEILLDDMSNENLFLSVMAGLVFVIVLYLLFLPSPVAAVTLKKK